MERTYIKDVQENVNNTVKILCWVAVVREQSKLMFFDFRDSTGLIQGVAKLDQIDNSEELKEIKKESAVEVIGLVKERPENNRKEGLNGGVELEVKEINVLNQSDTPPIDLTSDGKDIDEDVRHEYRFVDLRRPRLQDNILKRNQIAQSVRSFLLKNKFIEIETPCLTRPTPEGARDYLVPSRVERGAFYSLPQSPQQYKQLLMTAGFEKYFQIAKCFRDEDSRGDRQPEFTQIDLEISFTTQEEIMQLNEKMLIEMIKEVYPEKVIQETPFPRLTYKEAMDKYGSDRPDIRKDKNDPNLLAFCWIIDFPFFEKAKDGSWTFTHNPFSAPQEKYEKDIINKENIENILAAQFDLSLNGSEIMGGSLRTHKAEVLKSIFSILGYDDKRINSEFGHLLKAFSFGTPPHGGCAYGFDRLVMILQNEENIREVIAFPKTRDGREKMIGSPAETDLEQLQELGIRIEKKKE